MIERAQVLPLLNRIVNLRTETLRTRPFFGRLLLHLKIGFAESGTAYTDMKQIVFDPSFAGPMSDDELWFLMMHELMHCVLHHCTRGEGLDPLLYNIACDIVVNSLIEETLGVTDFIVAGQPAMHLAPNKKEGRVYTAEQVYEMLQKASPKTLQQMYGLPTPPKKGEGDGEDGSH